MNSTSQGATFFSSHVQSCRAAAAPGAPTATTELGQRRSWRLRLCQEIAFLGTCSESNLKVFRGAASDGLGLRGALSDNFSSSDAAGVNNNERKAQEKPLGGRACPLAVYAVERLHSSASPERGCCSRILGASPGSAQSEPRAAAAAQKEPRAPPPPAPLCRPFVLADPPPPFTLPSL